MTSFEDLLYRPAPFTWQSLELCPAHLWKVQVPSGTTVIFWGDEFSWRPRTLETERVFWFSSLISNPFPFHLTVTTCSSAVPQTFPTFMKLLLSTIFSWNLTNLLGTEVNISELNIPNLNLGRPEETTVSEINPYSILPPRHHTISSHNNENPTFLKRRLGNFAHVARHLCQAICSS